MSAATDAAAPAAWPVTRHGAIRRKRSIMSVSHEATRPATRRLSTSLATRHPYGTRDPRRERPSAPIHATVSPSSTFDFAQARLIDFTPHSVRAPRMPICVAAQIRCALSHPATLRKSAADFHASARCFMARRDIAATSNGSVGSPKHPYQRLSETGSPPPDQSPAAFAASRASGVKRSKPPMRYVKPTPWRYCLYDAPEAYTATPSPEASTTCFARMAARPPRVSKIMPRIALRSIMASDAWQR